MRQNGIGRVGKETGKRRVGKQLALGDGRRAIAGLATRAQLNETGYFYRMEQQKERAVHKPVRVPSSTKASTPMIRWLGECDASSAWQLWPIRNQPALTSRDSGTMCNRDAVRSAPDAKKNAWSRWMLCATRLLTITITPAKLNNRRRRQQRGYENWGPTAVIDAKGSR